MKHLKPESHLPERLVSFASMKALKKSTNNAFYFISKSHFALKICNFCPDLF